MNLASRQCHLIDHTEQLYMGGADMGSDTRGTAFTKVMESTVELHIGDKFIRTMVFTMVISMMSATMFNIVLPEISQEYELTYRQVSWVSSAYLLVYAIGSMIYGKLSDRYRLKSLLTMGLLLLSVGSLIGLVAQNYWMVLLSRIIQATGASVIPALAMVVPARYIPTERRGKVLGIMASGLAFGGVLGPIASAVVANFAHWRWLFVIPLTTLIALPLFRRYLVSEKVRSPIGMDWIGDFYSENCSVTTISSYWRKVVVSHRSHCFDSAVCGAYMLGCTTIRRAAPVLQRSILFRDYIGVLVSAIGFSIPFLTPIMLDDIYNLTPGTIGLVMVPASLTAAFLGKPAENWQTRREIHFYFYSHPSSYYRLFFFCRCSLDDP